LALALSACAHAPPPGPDLSVDPGPLAEAWRRPTRVLDGRTGAPVDGEALAARLAAARVIYIGEKHDRAADHAAQVALIARLHQQDPSLALGMEMFKRPFQKWVSDYVAGRIDEPKLLAKTEWAERWGFDFALYRPILRFARDHHLPVLALNARDEITRQVARQGLASLDPVDRDTLPELDLEVATHRARLEAVFAQHGHGKLAFEGFYAAQVIWDETMAHEVAAALAAEDPPHRVVVLAGSGHVRYRDGIPERAARRGATPYLTIYPMVVEGDGDEEVQEALTEGDADLLWVMRE
jgi:uncharacterized iron-regulated protein